MLKLSPRLDDKIIALPLEFEYLPVEIISKEFTKLNSPHTYRIHYLGPRFTNTLVLHKKYSSSSPAVRNSREVHYFEELYGYEKYEVQMRKIVQSNYLNVHVLLGRKNCRITITTNQPSSTGPSKA